MADEINRSFYIFPNNTPVCALDCLQAFNMLSAKEKLYAHYMAKASFDGSLIVFCQVSPESAQIFVLFYRLFSSESIESLQKKSSELGWTDDEFKAFLVYSAGFYANSGNYRGFGDTKVVPNIPKEKLSALLKQSEAAKKYDNFMQMYERVEEYIFLLEPRVLQLGFPDKAVTGYLSKSITKTDTDLVDEYLKAKHFEGWNSRLIKRIDANNQTTFIIRLASQDTEDKQISSEAFKDVQIVIERGDYAPILAHTIQWLQKALEYVANDNQKEMIENYIKHFQTGNLLDHMNGSRCWIRDKAPEIESYIGFIENYRDPAGTRAEFEGFVAAVNKETSKKFQELVRQAEELLRRLPWDKEYEKDKFLKPDFTSLDVIAFGGSGIPAGINIPNYDSIRQDEGFKNVSLGNVIAAMPKQKINFLGEKDVELFLKYYKEAFEVQVGLHELLGHGSGKLLQRNKDGSFNFDKENLKHMITGQPIETWYEPGETWSSKFGALASAYEECRAEAVGYFLCTYPDVLKIFGYEGEMADTIKYVNWMSEIRAGLLALEFFSPETKSWGQAHCFARYTLLKVCLEADEGFVKITNKIGDDEKEDLLFELDSTKIDSVGKIAVGNFLRKLQAYKSVGDNIGGSKFFNEIGSVNEKELEWRNIVVARRQPRRFFVQSNTFIDNKGEVSIKSYPETVEGIIESFVERYSTDVINDLERFSLSDSDFSITN